MSINLNSHFSNVPTLTHERSTYNMSCNIKTSFNVGEVIPFFCTEVLPGDTWKLDTNKVLRTPPMVTAPMDNLYLDTYYFYVPNRILWEHWREFLGENRQSAWIPTTEYEIPQLRSPSGGWQRGTIADYFGIPVGKDKISVNALPFRAYAMIIDEWFRSQNVQQPISYSKGDAFVNGSNGSDYVTDLAKGGKPFIANKYFDLFTSCLPSPQKGPDVTVNLTNDAPVYPTNTNAFNWSNQPLDSTSINFAVENPPDSGNYFLTSFYDSVSGKWNSGYGSHDPAPNMLKAIPNNLWAQLSDVSVITINQLRQAFQIQRFYEKNARGGTRYRELLQQHFGVILEDSRVQIPEYLGGNRTPINISQVTSTGAATSSPLGDVAGMSLTNDYNFDFQKSFTEHGFIIGLCVARYKHTYSQGLNKFWTKKDKFDFFWPTLANLGETAVLNREIFVSGQPLDNEVFGYNEMWYEYRYLPDMCTGLMRPNENSANSLAIWHFGDYYNSTPSLSSSWLQEDPKNVDRVLTVPAFPDGKARNQVIASNQLFADILVSSITTRTVPTYSIPGLIDHN